MATGQPRVLSMRRTSTPSPACGLRSDAPSSRRSSRFRSRRRRMPICPLSWNTPALLRHAANLQSALYGPSTSIGTPFQLKPLPMTCTMPEITMDQPRPARTSFGSRGRFCPNRSSVNRNNAPLSCRRRIESRRKIDDNASMSPEPSLIRSSKPNSTEIKHKSLDQDSPLPTSDCVPVIQEFSFFKIDSLGCSQLRLLGCCPLNNGQKPRYRKVVTVDGQSLARNFVDGRILL